MADKKKILIVDDNTSYLDILSINLKSAGFDVVGISDGLEAVFKAKQEKPDLIILDLMLPHMDGHKVCRFIKHDRQLQNIPIVIITSRDTQEDSDKAKEGGADGFLTKPTTIDTILSEINKHI